MLSLKIDDMTELRLLQDEHAAALFALTNQNRAYLREWLPWVDDTRTPEDTRRFIRAGLRQMENENGFHMGIWYQANLTGVVSYNYISHEKQQTELGYWLGAQFQGKGLMTAACRTLTTYAFDTLNLKRVEIRCAVANAKSRAIPVRLGFTEEGIVPQLEWLYDHYVDAVVYSMSAEKWSKFRTTRK